MPSTLHAQAKAPHIVAAFAANAIAGIVQLTSGTLPNSIDGLLPIYIAHMWSVLLIIGGVTGLFGVYIKDSLFGLRLESAGHVGVLGGCMVYAVALMVWIDYPWWPQPAVWWALSLSAASGIRWFQIVYTIYNANKKAKKIITEGAE